LKQIKAAGGVLYRKENSTSSVLLIKRNGVWDLPKGKLEEGESIPECAVREVAEETGSSMFPDLKSLLCETYHEYFQEGQSFGKTTYWYSMEANQVKGLEPERVEGITELRWEDPKRAIQLVGFENLKTVLRAFLELNSKENKKGVSE